MRRCDAISEDSFVVLSDGQVCAELLDEEVVILSFKDGMYYGLNPVGARIWNLIQEPIRVREVRDSLLEEFQVDPVRCARELRELLRELADKGLIELREESPL